MKIICGGNKNTCVIFTDVNFADDVVKSVQGDCYLRTRSINCKLGSLPFLKSN